MDIELIRTFTALAEAKNYEEACEILFVSKSTVSNRIKLLCQEIGFNPFVSKRNGIMLNKQGEELLSCSKEILLLMDQIMRIKEEGQDVRHLRIGGGEYYITSYVLPIVMGLQKSYPHVEITVDIDTANNLVDKMMRGTLDAVITWEQPRLQNLPHEKITQVYMGCAFLPDHSLKEKKLIRMNDVVKYPLLVRQRGSFTRMMLDEWLRKRKHKSNIIGRLIYLQL